MAVSQTTKQWLYSIRSIGRRKRAIIYEISGIKEEKEAVYDTAHALYGEDAKAAIKPNTISDSTYKKAAKAVESYDSRLNSLLDELERLNLEIKAARDRINQCFEEGNISVQEYEVIFYYYFEGMSNEEVAEVMNYSVQSVYRLKVACAGRL